MLRQKKISKIKKKPKIYRKYQDFYKAKDSIDPDAPKPIPAPDAKKYISHPSNLANEQDFSKDEKKMRLRVRKFCMKTDILRIREITRNKFVMYSSEQRFLEKSLETKRTENMFQHYVELHKLMDHKLKEMEDNAFKKMLETHAELDRVQSISFNDELNEIKDEHQRVLMEAQVLYSRFMFLLKLICYFDDRALDSELLHGANGGKFTMSHPPEIFQLNIGGRGFVTQEELELLTNYMEKVVRPYLLQRNHLNGEIWLEGFERNRRKISNYNKRFAQVALLNHIVTVIHSKYEKTYLHITAEPIYLKNADYLQIRLEDLKERAHKLINMHEVTQHKDKLCLKIRGIVPIVLQNLRKTLNENHLKSKELKGKEKQIKETKTTVDLVLTEQHVVLAQVEEIQHIVQDILSKMAKLPSEAISAVEKRIRRQINAERQKSRRALIKQNRLKNWIEHFQKHQALKDK